MGLGKADKRKKHRFFGIILLLIGLVLAAAGFRVDLGYFYLLFPFLLIGGLILSMVGLSEIKVNKGLKYKKYIVRIYRVNITLLFVTVLALIGMDFSLIKGFLVVFYALLSVSVIVIIWFLINFYMTSVQRKWPFCDVS